MKKALANLPARKHADILRIKRDASGKIQELQIAVAFLQWTNYPPGHGELAFRCPFCRTIHYHHAGKPVLGIRNGLHIPHCHDPAFGIRSVALHKQLAQSWFFDFVEVQDYRRAGPFPRNLHPDLKRYVKARKAPGQTAGGSHESQ